MSFCHEETAEAVDGRAVGVGGPHAAPAQATAGQSRSALGIEPGVFRTRYVQVGRHKPPAADELGGFLRRFEEAYAPKSLSKSRVIIASAAVRSLR